MILSAHQPAYLPWLGLFHKIALADRFLILDDVAMSGKDSEEWSNRNRIKTYNGPQILTVPVHRGQNVLHKDVTIANEQAGWQRKHWSAIEPAYRKTPWFGTYGPGLSYFYSVPYEHLTDLNADMLEFFLNALHIGTKIERASGYEASGAGSGRLLALCNAVGADTFIFGSNGSSYADVDAFRMAQVSVTFQHYRHPVYRQQHGSFLPYMSIIDLLFNEGPRSKDILMGTM